MDTRDEFKTGELARAFRVNPNTIRSWADQYEKLLSTGATAAKRTYTSEDALLLATVAEMRSRGLSFDAISESLESGQRIGALPPIPSRQEAERKQQEGIVLQSEYEGVVSLLEQERSYRQRLEQELERVMVQRDEMQRKLESETSEIRDQWRSEVENLNRRIIELERDLGETGGKLAIISEERRPVTFWLMILAAVIVVVSLVAAGIVFALMSRPAG